MNFSFLGKNKKGKKNSQKGIVSIEAYKNTPEIYFDKSNKILKIIGSSYPEDASVIYKPILEWLNEIRDEVFNNFSCEFSFNFISSSSHKMIYEILIILEDFHSKGINVKVVWYYEESDEDIMEVGEDFGRILSLPIRLVEIGAFRKYAP